VNRLTGTAQNLSFRTRPLYGRVRNLLFLFSLLLCILAALAPLPSFAQGPATGTPPYGSFSGGPDVINLGNNNIHFCIPVLNKPGRGMNFPYELCYDSSLWSSTRSGSAFVWTPNTNFGWGSSTAIASGNTGYITYISTTTFCYVGSTNGYPTGADVFVSSLTYVDAWGVAHAFPGSRESLSGSCGSSNNSTFQFPEASPDGSGYTIKDVGGPVIKPDGTNISPPINPTGGNYVTTVTDHNGNKINSDSSGHFFDTLSGTTPVVTITGTGTPSSPTVLTYTPPNTSSSRCASTNTSGVACFAISYVNYTVATNFAVSATGEYKSAAVVALVSNITLPDGSQYGFTYEPTPAAPSSGACTPYAGTTCVTGRITRITLPTGGNISYAYSGGAGTNGSGIFSDGTTGTLQRTVFDGANTGAWTYARSFISGNEWKSVMTDPAGNDTVLYSQKASFMGLLNNFYETQRSVYQGSQSSGTRLKTVNTCYGGAASPCIGTAVTSLSRITQFVAYPDNSGKVCEHDIFTFNGMTGEQADYDYGNGAPASSPLRRIFTIFNVYLDGVSTPHYTTICNGTGTSSGCSGSVSGSSVGTVVAQTNFGYDETAVVATSGTPQQIPPIGNTRHNLTTTKKYKDATNFLTATATYFDTGNVKTATDVNGAQTTSNFAGSTSTCGNSFPTSITEAISTLSQSTIWNCTGAVATQFTDENGKNATTSYNDPYFWRPASVTDAASAVTNFSYLNPTTKETTLSINANSAVDSLATLDGIGRGRLSQTRQAPGSSTLDTVQQDYDNLGRATRSTLPFAASAGATSNTAPAVTTTYDALGRPLTVTDAGGGTVTYSYNQNDVLVTTGPAPTGENTKRRQLEYDALGRLTSVCELTTAAGSGTCGQSIPQTGFWTKYSYDVNSNLVSVTQNAQAAVGSQQTRSFTFDFLSRLTSETNPENGITTYTYDSAPGCTGTYNGDLVKKVDALGNTTCFTYDALHRKLSATYPSGTYASVTPSKYFVYDSATVNSVAMTNAKGRLAEAYTCATCPGTKLTDIGFSYTNRGEVSDVYESTQHSGGYYHLTQSYWPHGSPNVLAGIPGLPTITYGGTIGSTVGLDGEGRITQITASSGANPVTGTVFNPYGTPPSTTVTFGSADSDGFFFDATTNRLTQYKFNVGTTQSMTGALTWNANSTLKQLAITDPFNSSDTQTCTYGYDDLTRLTSANCGTPWSGTYTFDAFGNLAKSGSMNFAASYSNSTNRMTLVGAFTPSYDANGNVLNDGTHTYTWDADGNSITADGVGLTFDALDRTVEQNRSGTYTQIVYGPGGDKLALMSAQSLVKAFVPLSGGATAVYTSAGLDHYRHSDWLGSNRLSSTPSRTVQWSGAYAPWGELYASSPPGSSDPSFTGQNSDTSSTGEYDFLYRQYGTQGRWPTPDPGGLAAVNPSSPQTWNRYAYVTNNPLSLIDRAGLDCVYMNGDGTLREIWRGENCMSDTDDGYFIDGTVSGVVTNNGQVTGVTLDGSIDAQPVGFDYNNNGSVGFGVAAYGDDTPLPDMSYHFEWFPGLKGSGTFAQCMERNNERYSLGGAAVTLVGGNDTALTAGNVLGGNMFLEAAYGGSNTHAAVESLEKGLGAPLTYGRRSSDIKSLNLAGKGGLPQSLSASGKGLRSAVGKAGKALSLGLTMTERAIVDGTFAVGEGIACSH